MFFNVREIEAPELARQLDENADSYQMVDVREMREIMAGTVDRKSVV